MNMPLPPPEDDTTASVQVGLADMPTGQFVAVVITVLLGRDKALVVADGIRDVVANLSTTGLATVPTGGLIAATAGMTGTHQGPG